MRNLALFVAIAFFVSSCTHAYREGPITESVVVVQEETVLWMIDGTKYTGTVWSVDGDSLLFRTDEPGEAGVVKVALQNIELMKLDSPRGGAPGLVKIGFWALLGFAGIVLVSALLDGPVVDLSPDSN